MLRRWPWTLPGEKKIWPRPDILRDYIVSLFRRMAFLMQWSIKLFPWFMKKVFCMAAIFYDRVFIAYLDQMEGYNVNFCFINFSALFDISICICSLGFEEKSPSFNKGLIVFAKHWISFCYQFWQLNYLKLCLSILNLK